MPQLVNDILCLSIDELDKCGISKDTVYKGVKRSLAHWQRANIDGYWLVYRPIKAEYKAQITAHFGDVERLAHSDIVEALDTALLRLRHSNYKPTDYDFYRYESQLPEADAQGLADTASWLRLMASVSNKTETKALGLSGVESKADLIETLHKFFEDTEKPFGMVVKNKLVSLAYLSKRVREFGALLKKDEKKALALLISKKRANGNAKKLAEPAHEAALRQLLAKHQGLNYENVAMLYNNIAKELGWKAVSRSTVANFHKRNRKKIETMRVGFGAWKGELDYSIKRERPSAPLYLIENDGTPVELYYQKEVDVKGKTKINSWGRKVAVVVLDVFNDYPLGYALGEQETALLIREAYADAFRHIKELTGSYYQPWQVKTDNYARNQTRDLIQKIAYYTEDRQMFATVGNARDKVIEGWFSRSKEKYMVFNENFSGYNITSKGEQPNREYLQKICKTFPDEAGLHEQFENFINFCRLDKPKDSEINRQQLWLNSFLSLNEEDKRPMDRLKFLDVFGIERGNTNRLTNKGIEPLIMGEKRHYMLFEHEFYDNIGDNYSVKYDPYDLDSVLGINQRTGEIVKLTTPERPAMALKDMTESKDKSLREQIEFKKKEKRRILASTAQDLEILQPLITDSDTIKVHLGNKLGMQQAENEAKQLSQPTEKKPKKTKEIEEIEETPAIPNRIGYSNIKSGDKYHF